MTDTQITVRPVRPDDEARWCELFRAYREFYRLEPSDAVVDRVWGWMHDPALPCGSLVAELGGQIVGIANHRDFLRPSAGTIGIWLDDLFTDPEMRGKGIGRALIEALQAKAAAEGKSLVRWITAEDNHQAQALYDTLATRTSWVTYDAVPRAN
ncbi:GNAT family N-acetyltransferase [Gulosibacter bifidus]|uniref:GNAT family N-acetyltransferase n=1 Tax=Gulosibacter bifidus TaxID=272239 RepID=A0ABW5RLF5_9MICO|nr:GNAT family N-acetyltransferase [Gulosibacter bifidus]